MISINTNVGAMIAVQNLSKSGLELATTQNRISTGLKVSSAKDNGAIWAIANKMSSDVKAYDSVLESADLASAKVDTAIAAGESIMDLLNQMKSKALSASQNPGAALQADFSQLRSQITSAIANASFDGANMIGATPASAVAIGDAAGGNNITVAGADLSLGGAIVSVAAGDTVATAGGAATALTNVNASITALGTQLATWGAGSKRLDTHKAFIGKLQDALTSGIGSLTDADLAKESAKLTALQTKQQLGVQALSIANSTSQSALSLFR